MRKPIFFVYIILSVIICSNANNLQNTNESIHELWINDWTLEPIDEFKLNGNTNINYQKFNSTITAPWQMLIPELKLHHSVVRYTQKIDLNNEEKIGLLMPICFGKYAVYINNNLLIEKNKNYGQKPFLKEIPHNYLNFNGSNKIIILIESYSGWGGFSGYTKLGSYTDINKFWIRFIIENIAISFIALFISIYFVIMFFFRKRETYNLYFSLMSISICLFIMGYTGLIYYIIDTSWAYWLLTYLGGIGMYLFPILFLHSFYNLKLKIIPKIFTGFYIFLASFVVLEFLLTKQLFYFNTYIYGVFNISYILVVIYLVVLSIKALKQKLINSKEMLIGTILLAITFIYSMLCFAAVIVAAPLIGEGFFAMTLVFSVILSRRSAQTHADLEVAYAKNLDLTENLEHKVEERTIELKQKNSQIIESISYSTLIQNAMLPSHEFMEDIFSDFYVIWKPKDLVSGDFYWVHKLKDGFLVAVIDCTGHGVPGALLTMTVDSVLERIITHINSDDPSIILGELNKIIKETLSQQSADSINDDGLDIGLCHFSNNSRKLTFAGSKIKLHIDDGETIKEIKGDKQGIGYKRSKLDYTYNNYVIDVDKNITFHMTTDGFPDQQGGVKGYSFGWTNYREMLKENRSLPLNYQAEQMEQKMFNYQEENEQRDDMTLIGFKIKLD